MSQIELLPSDFIHQLELYFSFKVSLLRKTNNKLEYLVNMMEKLTLIIFVC